VLDVNGLVIGVVTAKIDTPKVFKKTGRVMRNVGIAISRRTVLDFLKRHGVDYSTRRGGIVNGITLAHDILQSLAFIAAHLGFVFQIAKGKLQRHGGFGDAPDMGGEMPLGLGFDKGGVAIQHVGQRFGISRRHAAGEFDRGVGRESFL
jgi:hypothetical protein